MGGGQALVCEEVLSPSLWYAHVDGAICADVSDGQMLTPSQFVVHELQFAQNLSHFNHQHAKYATATKLLTPTIANGDGDDLSTCFDLPEGNNSNNSNNNGGKGNKCFHSSTCSRSSSAKGQRSGDVTISISLSRSFSWRCIDRNCATDVNARCHKQEICIFATFNGLWKQQQQQQKGSMRA